MFGSLATLWYINQETFSFVAGFIYIINKPLVLTLFLLMIHRNNVGFLDKPENDHAFTYCRRLKKKRTKNEFILHSIKVQKPKCASHLYTNRDISSIKMVYVILV